uniref:Uncharacterized protein n=1 Tax=Cacopsylla melanoneura TaxID=428564 RepID=A0A8D8SG97_9HEMI
MYLLQSNMMWCTVRGVLHISHWVISSFFIRYWCVRCVCPILILVRTTCCLLFKFSSGIHILTSALMARSLFPVVCFHVCSHLIAMNFFINALASSMGTSGIVIQSGEVHASFAALSASSLPFILTWEGTHMNSILLFLLRFDLYSD